MSATVNVGMGVAVGLKVAVAVGGAGVTVNVGVHSGGSVGRVSGVALIAGASDVSTAAGLPHPASTTSEMPTMERDKNTFNPSLFR